MQPSEVTGIAVAIRKAADISGMRIVEGRWRIASTGARVLLAEADNKGKWLWSTGFDRTMALACAAVLESQAADAPAIELGRVIASKR